MVLSAVGFAVAAGAPVIDAVKSGNVEAVRVALQKRADVNPAEADGMTALHWAARNNDLASARLLLRAGASTKATTRYGVTPLDARARRTAARRCSICCSRAEPTPTLLCPEGETRADDGSAHREARPRSRCSARTAPT